MFLIFLHIAKTAGSTFNRIVHQQYGLRILDCNLFNEHILGTGLSNLDQVAVRHDNTPQGIRQNFCYAERRLSYGLHAKINKPSAKHLTFTHNRVTLYLFLYNYARSAGWLEENVPFLEFLEMDFLGSNNTMTKQLNGDPSLDCGNSQAFRTDACAVTQSDFDQVVTQVETMFLLSASAEDFDESISLLSRELGWRRESLEYSVENWTPERYRLEEISDSKHQLSESLNEFNMMLHEYVKSQFSLKCNSPKLV